MSTPPIDRDGWAPLRRQLAGMAVALQFFTIIPPLVRRPFEPDEIGASVAYFPLPGALIGALLIGAQRLLASRTGPLLNAAILLALWVVATGALHLDGLLDTCDGLFGGYTPEKRLEIMRDHRIGAYALAGGVLLLALKFAALAEMPAAWQYLLVIPLVARGGLALTVVSQPYARAQGLGATFRTQAGWLQAVVALALIVAAALLLMGAKGLLLLALILAVQSLVVAFVRTKIPGLTGDTYGAIVELGELAGLLAVAIL